MSVPLDSVLGGVKPCERYRVGLQVFGGRYDYCSEPRVTWQRLRTREVAPRRPEDLTLVNLEESFELGELRWRQPKEDSCANRYRQVMGYDKNYIFLFTKAAVFVSA